MKKHICAALLAGLIGFGFTPSARAAENSGASLNDVWATIQLRSVVRVGMSFDDARARFIRLFRQTDVNGGGISQSDYDEKLSILIANKRARTISMLLRKDLNGDGVVSMEELKAFYLVQARRPIRANGVQLEPTVQQVELMLTRLLGRDQKHDGDGDGTITFPEMLASAQVKNDRQILRMRQNRRNVPLDMDQDGDGTVSRQEFDQIIERVMAKADLNGDGRFSRDEVNLIRSRANEFSHMQRTARRAKKI